MVLVMLSHWTLLLHGNILATNTPEPSRATALTNDGEASRLAVVDTITTHTQLLNGK